MGYSPWGRRDVNEFTHPLAYQYVLFHYCVSICYLVSTAVIYKEYIKLSDCPITYLSYC